MDELINTLEHSLEKHGEKPMTNKWLLNLLKIARKKQENHLFFDEASIEDTY